MFREVGCKNAARKSVQEKPEVDKVHVGLYQPIMEEALVQIDEQSFTLECMISEHQALTGWQLETLALQMDRLSMVIVGKIIPSTSILMAGIDFDELLAALSGNPQAMPSVSASRKLESLYIKAQVAPYCHRICLYQRLSFAPLVLRC